PSCITINMNTTCGGTSTGVMVTIYQNTFDPNNVCINQIQQSGDVITNGSFSVTVPGSTTFILVVHELDQNGLCTSYTMTVTGDCSLVGPTPTLTPLVSFTPSSTNTPTNTLTPTITLTPSITPTPFATCGPGSEYII